MSILNVINEVAEVSSLDRFDSVYGADKPAAQTMLQLAQVGGKEIAQRVDWKGLQRVKIVDVTPLPFPADYDRMIDGGAVMSATGEFYRPVRNPSQWAVVKRVGSAQPFFYLSSSAIEFSPGAGAMDGVVTYITKNWIKKDSGEGSDVWTADDDTVFFPERLLRLDLIWRWRRKAGLNYDDQLAEFEAALAAEAAEDRG